MNQFQMKMAEKRLQTQFYENNIQFFLSTILGILLGFLLH